MVINNITAPWPYDKAIGDEICERLALGESLVNICRKSKDGNKRNKGEFPGRDTVYKWLRESDEFRAQHAQARQDQADSFADDITDIADDKDIDPDDKRVRIDARKWSAGVIRPKKYGAATLIKHADADGEKLSFANILEQIDGRTAGLPGVEGTAGRPGMAPK